MKKIILMMSLLLLFAVSCGGSKEFSVDVDGKGKIPSFELKELNSNKTVNAEKLMNNGKKTLFIVAAEWCPHCKEELPEVQKFYDANKDKVNVVIVFTNSRSSLGKAQAYIKENGYTVPAYAASKGGIAQLTKAFCNEWAEKGINVNALAPGYMDTEMNVALTDPNNPRFLEITNRIPSKRWGTPEDMKGPVIFLASAASDYLNGAIIPVDGGYLVK